MESRMNVENQSMPGESYPSSDAQSNPSDSTAFSSQLRFTDQQLRNVHSPPYDMAGMAAALQQSGHKQPGLDYTLRDMSSPALIYNMQQASQFSPHGGMHYPEPATMAMAQQRHYMPPHYGVHPRLIPIQTQGHPQMMPYGYGYSPTHMQNIDPRYSGQPSLPGYGMPLNLSPDHSYQRALSDSLPVPSFPRGPPRKPKQSGHALWVGNLPPSATVSDLKDHFSRDATKDIESVFLISKSNCAFVNYKTEAACIAAMSRFHDSRFGGVRLVCRLRRGSNTPSTPLDTDASSPNTASSPATVQSAEPEDADGVVPETPTIVGGSESEALPAATKAPPEQLQSPSKPTGRVPERYFVVKSLTLQDLEASVANAVWATQPHNEVALNQAFGSADNVYLIFSANKSGEYFGFARMASPITGEVVKIGRTTALGSDAEPQTPSDGPRSIATLPTATAPKGYIIDDSARGTIFWEADHSDEGGRKGSYSGEQDQGQEWGKQFKVEWISTARLPFYRTRGLRNPWNANREVKIARDGTELEPNVGRRLVSMFHRPMPLN